MDLGLKGKNALITGASQGIGFAIARALAEEGSNVALGARGRARLDEAAAELVALGVRAVPIAVDLATEEGCARFVSEAVAALGGCDILVNNVGGTVPGTLATFSAENWREIIDSNLMSYVYTSRFAVPHLKKSTAGRVLNISGISGRLLSPGAYSTTLTNAAIIGFNKLLAHDLAPFNILVNSLAPGTTNTESWGPRAERVAKMRGTTVEQVRAALAGMSLLNRLAEPAEIGAIAAFLVSERNSYMTGTTVESGGGRDKVPGMS
ncbi:MAG: SDR family oxidoreductase [Betaproteobacteria bacterium]|nr:SDR family oxidoreductase [Betaproteobacteria bacterium]